MGVIKGDAAGMLAKNAVVFDLADIARQADALLVTARAEASRIVEDARAERARLLSDAQEVGRKAGYEEGLRAGRSAGEQAGRAEAEAAFSERLAALDAAWSAALDSFAAEREDLLVGCKTDVLRMVLAVAARVVHRTVAADETVVLGQVAAALAQVGRATRGVIAVNPEDAELVRRELPGLAARAASIEHAEVVDDASLPRGSCVVRTSSGGGIDASIQTQLDRLAALLVPIDEASAATMMPLSDEDDGRASREDLAA